MGTGKGRGRGRGAGKVEGGGGGVGEGGGSRKQNSFQGSTPGLLAIATGCVGIAKLLVEESIDPSRTDKQGRGALVLATSCGGPRETFTQWLLANAKKPDGSPLQMTYGKGRSQEDKCRGGFGGGFPQADGLRRCGLR